MFIAQLCPRCEANFRKDNQTDEINCFFCAGYTYPQAQRKEWFLEETRKLPHYVPITLISDDDEEAYQDFYYPPGKELRF